MNEWSGMGSGNGYEHLTSEAPKPRTCYGSNSSNAMGLSHAMICQATVRHTQDHSTHTCSRKNGIIFADGQHDAHLQLLDNTAHTCCVQHGTAGQHSAHLLLDNMARNGQP
eukprot:scaffold171684_cov21-Tisochrysis_lutea.AAC.3